MFNMHGLISSAGSVALGTLFMTKPTLTIWNFIIGIIFVICGLLSLLDYVRCGGKS